MSIATKPGDGGQAGLSGGIRVYKTHPRFERSGTIDGLISRMGFARSIYHKAMSRCVSKQFKESYIRLVQRLQRCRSLSRPRRSSQVRW